MKIWFPTITAGSGSDVYVRRLAEGLQEQGHTCEITWFSKYYEFMPYLLAGKQPPPGTDIIHANSWNAFAFRRPGIPLVVTEHHCVLDPAFRAYKSSLQHLYHQHLIRRFENASFRHASRIIAVSRHTAASLEKAFAIQDARVIHNWVDTDRFRPADNDKHRNGRFRLLFVGNRSMRKGWDTACAVIDRLGDNFELAATHGAGGHDTNHHSDRIISLGYLDTDELVREYQRSDALLFPSRYEGFGYVALEAMACGIPVIAASNSAVPEVTAACDCGLLCQPEDVDCFANACRKLAEDSELRRQMGNSGREAALTKFSRHRLVSQYIETYRELVLS